MTITPPRSSLPATDNRTAKPGILACGTLVTAYVSAVVAANWTFAQWPAVSVGPLIVPAGTLYAGSTFTLRDLLHETLALRGVAAGLAVGTGVSWLVASPHIAVASALAFAVSEVLDSAIYALLRPRSRLRAVAGSNLAGLLVDSLVFVPFAFGSFAAVPGHVVGKTIATVLTLVLLRWVWRPRCTQAAS